MPKRRKKKSFSISPRQRFTRKSVIEGIALGDIAAKYGGALAVPLSLLSMLKGVDSSVKTAGQSIAIDHLTKKYLP